MCAMVPGKYLRLFFSDKMIRRVERYRYESQISTRSAAIRALIERSLIEAGIPDTPAPKAKKPRSS